MSTKLTLRLDEALIHRAKGYAQEQDRSVSQLVADYFANLTVKPSAPKSRIASATKAPALGPITAKLRGSLNATSAGAAVKRVPPDRASYRAHLEEKYL